MGSDLMVVAYLTVHLVALVAGAWYYLRRADMDIPPIGVFNRRDVYVIVGLLSVLPFVYQLLPTAALVIIQALVGMTVLGFTITAIIPGRAGWAITMALVALDTVLAPSVLGPSTAAFHLVNNLLVVLAVIGVSNLYVQSGLRSRDVVVFAVLLTIYDVVATNYSTVMVQLFERVVDVPFAPALLWGSGESVIGVGAGDLLVVALWSVVCEKAFGDHWWKLAAVTGVLAPLAMMLAFVFGILEDPLPAMVLLGPFVAVQYLFVSRTTARDRTMFNYRTGPSGGEGPERPDRALEKAVDLLDAVPGSAAVSARFVSVPENGPIREGRRLGDVVVLESGDQAQVPVVVWTTVDSQTILSGA